MSNESEVNDETSLAVGDVVYLKSGGQAMTIAGLDETTAVCVFFTYNMTGCALGEHRVPQRCLTRTRPKISFWGA